MDDAEKLKIKEKIKALENEISILNTRQMAIKIMMNSEYGAMSNEYFRHFSMEIAEAITSSGQLAIQWVTKHLDEYINRIIGTTGQEYVFYCDTDGIYVEFDKLVTKFFPADLPIEQVITMLDKVCADKIEPEIDRIYQQLAEYTNAHAQKMVMKREVLANRGIWAAKKRYALNVYDSEHVRYAEPKVKIMGLESVRSSIPEICRKAYAESVKTILQKDEDALHQYIADFKERFNTVRPEQISFPRGMNNMERYIDPKGQPAKGCPIHVRASIVYNQFLQDYDITEIETIKSGDKIKFVYLKVPNPLRSNVVGFPAYIPEKMLPLISKHIDYKYQFEKTFLAPIENLLSVIGWTPEKKITLADFFV